jgi:hypothetical protein
MLILIMLIVCVHGTILVTLTCVLLASLTLLSKRHTPNGITLGLGHLAVLLNDLNDLNDLTGCVQAVSLLLKFVVV